MSVRDVIVNLIGQMDANELHQFSVELAEKIEDTDKENRIFRDGDQFHFEQVAMIINESLSRIASEG